LRDVARLVYLGEKIEPSMKKPLRALKLHWHRIRNTRQVVLDGVSISTDRDSLPRFVRSALFKGTYETHEREFVRRLLRPGDRVLEIGAGIGVVSLVAAKICGGGKVLSYEANPLLEPIIRANYALNGLSPDLRMRAITLDGQPITFFRSDNIVSSSTKDRGRHAETLTVESDRLDDVVAAHRPDVIVMDVEGAEIDLLSNAGLTGVRHVVVEVHPHITGEDKIAAMLARLGSIGFRQEAEAHKTLLLSRN
jgi:FkbM family methyltransferase